MKATVYTYLLFFLQLQINHCYIYIFLNKEVFI